MSEEHHHRRRHRKRKTRSSNPPRVGAISVFGLIIALILLAFILYYFSTCRPVNIPGLLPG